MVQPETKALTKEDKPGHQKSCSMMVLKKNDIVMSSSLFMLITYYSVMTDTYERD